MIRVCVGSAAEFAEVEPIMAGCIYANASEPVNITFMRAGEHGFKPSGCTGFTMYRFAIPHLMGRQGFAIYLDVDMFLLADIAELWQYRERGKWVCLAGGANEVMVIDCAVGDMPGPAEVHKYKKGQLRPPMKAAIPPEWNCEDYYDENSKLMHFTDIANQPWRRAGHPYEYVWQTFKRRYGGAQ